MLLSFRSIAEDKNTCKITFLRTQGILGLHLFAGTCYHHRKDKGKGGHGDKSAHGCADIERRGRSYKRTDCINEISDGVADTELKPDSAPQPFGAFHFRVHRTDSCEARRCIKVEHEISKSRHFCYRHYAGSLGSGSLDKSKFIRIYEIFKPHKAYGQRTDHIFLCDKTGDCGGCKLPRKDAHDGHEQITSEQLEELRSAYDLYLHDILGMQSATETADLSGSQQEAFAGAMDLLLEIRAKAKASKDWETSDLIRDKLTALGFEIQDTKSGAEWKVL